MSLVTELSAEQWFVKVGGTNLKCQGTINVNLRARYANGRGSGDATPRPKAIGLEDGSAIDFTFIASSTGILTLVGTEVTNCDVMDDTTSLLGAFTGMFNCAVAGDVGGMVQFSGQLVPLTMPTAISHLDY